MTTKSRLLSLLEQSRGSFVSGQDAATQLHVSRAAVWKAVQALRAAGLPVEAMPGSGYRLGPDSDFLSPESLRTFLPADTPLQLLAETTSTNLVAKQWAMQDAAHGSLVVALCQTSGRGRLGRGFESPAGGIYMSVVLRPRGEMQATACITAAVAVAVCRAVESLCGIQLSIKWVNDLFFQGKKCCGILTEAASGLETGSLDYMVVGIGLNYTITQAAFSPAVQDIVTSLYPQGGAPVPRAQLCAEIHAQLLAQFETLATGTFLEEYRRRSLVLDRPVTVLAAAPYTATAVEIDDAARLVVQTPDGARHTLSSGEISVRMLPAE